YHAAPPPYTRTFMPPKPDLVFHDAFTVNETVPNVLHVEPSTTKPHKDMSQSDWVSDSEDDSEGEPMTTQKPPSFVQTSKHVKTPRTFVKPIEHPTPAAHLRKDIPKTIAVLTRSRLVPLNAARPVTTVVAQTNVNVVQGVKENWGNPQQVLKDKGVIKSGCSRHMTGNISYLSDFKEINGGYVAFGRNPKGGKITGKENECIFLSSDFKLPDENHVLLRVLRENNMYNVDLKNIIPSGDLTCVFAKATIKREFSVARTPQQNGIAERKNRTLIEATRTMLVDSLLPILFWVEAVNTACYVQNRVLVTKPHNKTPYELLLGRTPSIGFMRPFGCLVTILNTLYPLGNKAHLADFQEFKGGSVAFGGKGHAWMFDLDYLTNSMNYEPVLVENQANKSAGPKEANNSAEELEKLKRQEKKANDAARKEATHENQDANTNNINLLNVFSTLISTVGPSIALNDDEPLYPDDPSMPHLEDIYASLN
nr:hypothetical protein [Tanacetum cinerariifolium]